MLIAVHPDGFLEAFANKSVDVRFCRIPLANSSPGKCVAEDCFALMLPPRYRELWRRDMLRSNGTSRPLTAQAALDALAANDCLAELNRVTEAMERVA
ncbi:MAG: hypothetical protein C0485_19065 [Pirellula sp.]|nr:hypothetical protein [Pirellula sp.]